MPIRKIDRRNAIHVLVPYNKPQHVPSSARNDEVGEDWANNIDAAYSPASIPRDQVLIGCVDCERSFGYYPSSIYMVPEDESSEEANCDKNHDEPQCHLSSRSSTSFPSLSSSSSSASATNKKTVRFDESRNQAYDNKHITSKESCKSLWYTGEENRKFKACRAAAINEVAITDEMSRHRDPFSYRKVLLQTFEACSRVIHETEDGVLTAVEEDLLRQCLRLHGCRLGLERSMAIRGIANEERFRYHELLNVVTTQQHFNSRHKDEFLRRVCEDLSRPSRMFARHLAQAQASLI
jgi:hypothetical protein